MLVGSFDNENTLLTGTIQTEVREPGGAASERVTRMSQPCTVHFDWTVSGPVIPYLGGSFVLMVGLESIGTGVEINLPPLTIATTVSSPNASGVIAYSADVVIPASTVTQEGTYRVSKRLLYHGPFGGTQQAAFVEAEDIEFY